MTFHQPMYARAKKVYSAQYNFLNSIENKNRSTQSPVKAIAGIQMGYIKKYIERMSKEKKGKTNNQYLSLFSYDNLIVV